MAGRNSFGSVETLPSGRHRARYSVSPGRWRSAPTTFSTKAEAHAWLARARVAMEQAAAGSPKAAQASRPPRLSDYVSEWIAERRNGRGEALRPSARRTYESYLRLHIGTAPLGRLRLDEITPEHVRAWHHGLDPAHPTGRARVYAFLRTVLATAVADELIAVNPCRIRGAGQARAVTPVEVLTPQEVADLADAIGERYGAAIHLGAWCQMRVGEVLALRRRDVDLDARLVHVRRGVTWIDGRAQFGPPKTDAGIRDISMPAAVAQVLERHLAKVGPGRDALLFVGRTPGSPPPVQTFADSVKRAARRSGLPQTFRFHHLRHAGLSLLAEAGASVAELQSRAGHSTPAMALHYQHARAVRDRELAERLSAVIDQR